MNRKAIIDAQANRIVHFETDGGIEFMLIRDLKGGLEIRTLFNASPISLTNSHYRLDEEGARRFAHEIERLYDDDNDRFTAT